MTFGLTKSVVPVPVNARLDVRESAKVQTDTENLEKVKISNPTSTATVTVVFTRFTSDQIIAFLEAIP
jgi:hypothetical protein